MIKPSKAAITIYIDKDLIIVVQFILIKYPLDHLNLEQKMHFYLRDNQNFELKGINKNPLSNQIIVIIFVLPSLIVPLPVKGGDEEEMRLVS